MPKKTPKKLTSKYSLTAKYREEPDGKLLVELFTAKVPKNFINFDYRFRSIVLTDPDKHPFCELSLEKGIYNQSQVANGYYVELFTDSPVVRSIVDVLASPEKLQAAAGRADWRQYRARLVKALDMLWG